MEAPPHKLLYQDPKYPMWAIIELGPDYLRGNQLMHCCSSGWDGLPFWFYAWLSTNDGNGLTWYCVECQEYPPEHIQTLYMLLRD